MARATYLCSLLTAALMLDSCGGGRNGNASDPVATPAQAPQRGELLDNPQAKLASYSPSDLLERLAGSDIGKDLLQLAYTPRCTIDVYALRHATVGAQGETTTASGALMIPTGSDPACSGARPVVLYAHGRTTNRNFNIADLSSNGKGLLLAAVFPVEGCILVAPNYAGYLSWKANALDQV